MQIKRDGGIVFPRMHPNLQEGDGPFVRNITRLQAHTAVGTEIARGHVDKYYYANLFLDEESPLLQRINFDKAEEIAAVKIPWLQVKNLVYMVSEMNLPKVWETLLEQSPHMMSYAGWGLSGEAERISRENNRVMVVATAIGVLGAAFGKEVGELESTYSPNQGWEQTTRGIDVSRRIGNYFETPAESPQQLLDRLQELFPNGGQLDKKVRRGKLLPLFTQFLAEGIFMGDEDISGNTIDCPAPTLTKYMYEYYGRTLAKPDYQSRFMRTVSKPS